MSKGELLNVVRGLISDVTRVRFEGAAYGKLARAHGYADGYMRALLDAKIVERDELLRAIGEARVRSIETTATSSEATAAA